MGKNQAEKNFDFYLRNALDASGVGREELARHLGVAVPVVNRWLNGACAPDVCQFREIAHYLGMSYEWFLDGKPAVLNTEELAARLGLTQRTVDCLMRLAENGDENESMLDAVDLAVQAIIAVAGAVWEDLDRYADKVVEQVKGQKGALG